MNTPSRRRLAIAPLVATLLIAPQIAAAPSAAAHPLGNFTVNYSTALTLRPTRVEAVVVVDHAEIAAAQQRPLIDQDHDGTVTAPEQAEYARTACSTLGPQLSVDIDGEKADWKQGTSSLSFHPGEAGLKTSRLTCSLVSAASLAAPSDIRAVTHYDRRRIGWHEITATSIGVTLAHSTVPAVSSTGQLRHYPQDPLVAPLDQRTAELTAMPGGGTAARIVPPGLPGAGPVTTVLNKDTLVGSRELTLPVGLLALLLAVILGASHAALPGHGKTIMAAYLAGRRGTPRDAVTVGATVTVTHTTGVLILGLALPVATHLAGETVLAWLGLASGLLVTAIGTRLLYCTLRGQAPHVHSHSHDRHHDDGHEHDHHDGHGHSHSHEPLPGLPRSRRAPEEATPDGGTTVMTKPPAARPHHHHRAGETAAHTHTTGRHGRWALIGMGIAGGLVPSPSALIVLLGAVALGRTAFGILLVLGYGLGMAATLTLAGLLLVRVQDRITARTAHRASARLKTLARIGPAATAALVLLVGIGLAARAVTSL
ncbi:nickel transporter [Streptomyces sp. NPDC058685]|uniref:HoxN/HupN/NixA family nickel/cobalt transporter n=1 Tax=Streptomyces sp. NPDC058685 TaxID=3346598 RepID=UPI003648ACE0